MKRCLLLLTMCTLCWTAAPAQVRQKASSKRATKVDSVSAPPRMDGNTGKYDTVKQPRRALKKAGTRKRSATYNYKIGVDTISKGKPAGR